MVYLVAILVALVNAPAALVLHGIIALYYTFDQLRTPSAAL